MQAVVERITGTTLDAFTAARVFAPLGMTSTRFTPDTTDAALMRRIAPTAIDTSRGGLLHGVVHDPNAWAMGGVAGHAGLFSSARDLAIFAQMLLDGGSYAGTRILAPSTIARWTSRQSPSSSRALGWDTPAGLQRGTLLLAAQLRPHRLHRHVDLDRSGARAVRRAAHQSRELARRATRHAQLRRDVADAVQSAILDAPLIDWEGTALSAARLARASWLRVAAFVARQTALRASGRSRVAPPCRAAP